MYIYFRMKITLIRVYNFLYYTPAKYIALALKLLKVPARTESYIFMCDLSNNINFTYSLVGYRHFKNNYPAAEVETWNWLGKNLKESGAIIDVGADVGGRASYSQPEIISLATRQGSLLTFQVGVEKISSSKKTITCIKGKLTKKVTGTSPKCPTGYKLA